MSLTTQIIKEYNKTRITANSRVLCHAPFQSLNFAQGGIVTSCCYNRDYILGNYPQNNIHEIWFGENAEKLREYLTKNDLSQGCKLCESQIKSKNFSLTLAKNFDYQSDNPIKLVLKKSLNYIKNQKYLNYPRLLEFELSNTCNLECIMCNGHFSSSIRKNVEKLPAIKMAYDDKFVNQLTEFIPYLTDAKFLGGEPFLIPIYLKIWDKIIELNPKCKVHITTNASKIDSEIWTILNKLNATIIVSIESLVSENYHLIRRGADFNVVLNNINLLHEYTIKKGTSMSFTICPIVNNWQDIPELVQFAVNKKCKICFNTVIYPEKLSLRCLEKSKLEEIVDYYESQEIIGQGISYEYNKIQFEGLINLVKTWHKDQIN